MVQLEYRGKGTFCVGRKWFVCGLVEMVGRDAVLPLSYIEGCAVVLGGDGSDGNRDSFRVGGVRDFFGIVGGNVGNFVCLAQDWEVHPPL